MISAARFEVEGCIPALACGSWLAEFMQNRAFEELSSVTPELIEQALGGLPAASRHASALAADALRRLLRELERDRQSDTLDKP